MSNNKSFWGDPLPEEVINNANKRINMYNKLIEEYPNDIELKHISMEDLADTDNWFKKYGYTLNDVEDTY